MIIVHGLRWISVAHREKNIRIEVEFNNIRFIRIYFIYLHYIVFKKRSYNINQITMEI